MRTYVALGCFLVLLCSAAPSSPIEAQSDPAARRQNQVPIRLRIHYGGGEDRTWRGRIWLTDGRIDKVIPLGMSADAGGTIFIDGNQVQLRSIKPIDFAGLDIEVTSHSDDQLHIELSSTEAPQERTEQVVPIHRVLASSAQSQIDTHGNRLEIFRAPGDQLRVTFERDHLVFSPNEECRLGVSSFYTGLSPQANMNLDVQVTEARTSRGLWASRWQLSSNASGAVVSDDPIVFPVPATEGAYDVQLRISPSARGSRFKWSQSGVQRKFQIVVVDGNPSVTAPQLWRETANIDPAQADWRQKISRIPSLTFNPLSSSSLKNEHVGTTEFADRSLLELYPGGWQAIPLRVGQLGKPHLIEIEYLDRGPMALGISVLQPDVTGQIPFFGADSGVQRSRRIGATGEAIIRRHRMFVWPSHRSPYLLLANRHQSESAVIGAIRVLSGPDELGGASPVLQGQQQRDYLAFYEKPLLVDNFAASKSLDPQTKQSISDWGTFLEAADRWCQYLKANGYTGAMLLVAGDGSTLYPSDLLQPTPRFDNGLFSTLGLDPMRKDVLEMLLRVFDREGLKLVPVMHFNTPIKELERVRATAQNPVGLEMVDLKGSSRLETFRESSDAVGYYNPLDSRVQSAMSDAISELIHRYRSHRSFGGLGLLYSKDAAMAFPGQTWGMDGSTMRQFIQDAEVDPEVAQQRDFMTEFLAGPLREPWLKWRSNRASQWLSGIADELRRAAPSTRLFVVATDVFQSQDAFSAIAPSLRRNSDLTEAALRVAFPIGALEARMEIVFLRPYEMALESTLNVQRSSFHTNLAEQDDLGRLAAGYVFSHRSQWAHFAQLEQAKPFGSEPQQALMRMQPMVPTGYRNRGRFAEVLAQADCQYLVEGGWVCSFGQERNLDNWIATFTRLPSEHTFTEVRVGPESESVKNVVLRQAIDGERWYFYVVNPTPWAVTVRLSLQTAASELLPLSEHSMELRQGPTGKTLELELEPYDIAAASADQLATIDMASATFPIQLADQLRTELDKLTAKLRLAMQPRPLNVLQNPGFEALSPPETTETLNRAIDDRFGWIHDPRIASYIQLSGEAPRGGASCLNLSSSGGLTWIRSNEIPAPETGRLSIAVWLRAPETQLQPPFRISIQGDDGREVYYRYGTVSSSTSDGKSEGVGSEWKQFAVHFDDLPPRGLSNLHIGFDLMGAGSIDIDDVQIFDRWLDKQDSRSLTQQLAVASDELVQRHNFDRCRRILEGYWPRFLAEYFPAANEIRVGANSSQAGEDQEAKNTWLDNLKSVPEQIFPKR